MGKYVYFILENFFLINRTPDLKHLFVHICVTRSQFSKVRYLQLFQIITNYNMTFLLCVLKI